MSDTNELRKEFAAKQNKVATLFKDAEERGGDWSKVEGLDGDEEQRFEQLRTMSAELDDLRGKITEAEKRSQEFSAIREAVMTGMPAPLEIPAPTKPQTRAALPDALGGVATPAQLETRSLGMQFASHVAQNGELLPMQTRMEMRALFGRGILSTAPAGMTPESTRTGDLVELPWEPQSDHLEIIPQIPHSQSSYVYMEQTARTANAAFVDEAATFPDATITYTERSVPVLKLGTSITVTDESLMYNQGIQTSIDMDLTQELRERIANLVINAPAASSRWTGLLGYTNGSDRAAPASGQIGLIAKRDSQSEIVAILEAANLCFTHTGIVADAAIVHPSDWFKIRTTRGADGSFQMGDPNSAVQMMPFGLPMRVSTSVPEGTAIVGAFQRHARIADGQRTEVLMVRTHADDFLEGKQTIRASVHMAFWLRQPNAFWEVTL